MLAYIFLETFYFNLNYEVVYLFFCHLLLKSITADILKECIKILHNIMMKLYVNCSASARHGKVMGAMLSRGSCT